MLLDRRHSFSELAGSDAASWPGPRRPVWEIETGTLVVVLGVLLGPSDLQALLRTALREDADGLRDDLVLRRVAEGCSLPGALAAAVAAALDRAAAGLGVEPGGCPLGPLASWWQVARDSLAGHRLAALLWTLSRDPRWELRGLEQRVSGDLLVRALRLLGASRLADPA